MTAAEKRLERLHILLTMQAMGYPAPAAAICEQANVECSVPEGHHDLDAIDALPLISPRGITSKLSAMSFAGLVVADALMAGDPLLWWPTTSGFAAIDAHDLSTRSDPAA